MSVTQPPFPRPVSPSQPPASGAIAPGMEALSDEGPLHFTARALAAQLRTVFPPSRFDFQYLDGKLSKSQWDRLTRRPPCVCLGWAGVTSLPGSGTFMGVSHWFVGLITRSDGGPQSRLLGDRVGPGILAMVRAATIALNGFVIDPAETPWAASGATEITAVQALYNDEFTSEATTLAGVEVAVRYEEMLPPSLDTINHFDALQIGWSFSVAPTVTQWTDTTQQGTT